MDRERLVEELFLEWQERRDRGDPVEPEDLIRAHPDLEAELRSHFAALSLVDRAFSDPPRRRTGPPREIGDFRILREIDRGGMGVVFEAEQKSMGRRVALKVLSSSLTTAANAVQRFRREARAAGRLHHTNIVQVYGMGQHDGHWYYAMELVEGRSLAKVLAELGPRPTERSLARGEPASELTARHLGTDTGDRSYFLRAAEMFAGVADGLEVAHQAGIIHRDIKPSNLLLDTDGELRIVDFGLTRLGGEGPSMTITGELLGTPVYMSPEQALAKSIRVDHRTDVYSLGATLYQALTLQQPFRGESLHDICSAIIARDPVRPRQLNPRLPRDLETIVLKAMEKDRDRRYGSAGAMARDLRRFAEGTAIHARRVGLLGRAWRRVRRRKVRSALIAAVLVLAVAGGLLAARAARESARRLELEYARLCAAAADALAESGESGNPWASREHEARALYTAAIELAPDRPAAYLSRALAAGAELEARLEDVDRARKRGLPRATFHLARAHLFCLFRPEQAERERLAAARYGERTPLGAYFEARLLARVGESKQALALLTEAIEASDRRGALRYLALRARSEVRLDEDPVGALEDLHRLRELGDDSAALELRIAATWRRAGNDDAAERLFARSFDRADEARSEGEWKSLCRECWSRGEFAWHARTAEQALALHPTSPDLLAEGAMAAYKEKRWNDQLDLCDLALQHDPDHHFAHEVRAGALAELGRYEDALEACDLAVKHNSLCPLAHLNRSIVLFILKRFPDAADAARRSLELHPTHPVAWLARGQALIELGELHEAKAALERSIELDPGSGMAYHRLDIVLGQLGEYQESLRAAERAAELAPDVREIRFDLALAHKRLGQWKAALAAVTRATELDPAWAVAQYERGWILNRLGRPADAVAAYEIALTIDPGRAEVWNDRGIALASLRRFDEALAAYDEAIRIDPETADAHNNRGNALRAKGKPVPARAAFERAIDLEPKNATFHYNLGCVLAVDLEEPKAGLEEYEHAIALDGGEASYHNNRGAVLMDLKRYAEALDSFRRAFELGSGDHVAHCNLGRALNELGRFDEALGEFERALARAPGDAWVLVCRGEAFQGLRRHEQALDTWADAMAGDPESAHWCRGQVLREMQRFGEALAEYDDNVADRPECGHCHAERARLLALLGRFGEVGEPAKKALAFPMTEWVARPMWASLRLMGKQEPALEVARRLPPGTDAHLLVASLRAVGRHDEARQVAAERASKDPPRHRRLEAAYLWAVAGDRETATALLEAWDLPWMPLDAYARARVHAVLGERDSALAWLGRAVEAGLRRPAEAAPDPDFAALADEPRFRQLVNEAARPGSGRGD